MYLASIIIEAARRAGHVRLTEAQVVLHAQMQATYKTPCALTGRPARNTVPASDALHLTAPGCNRDRLLQGEPTPPVKTALMKGRH